jgi:ABC-type uncharacterized transport system substrate-binding protein
MRRRDFLGFFAGAALARPLAANAQQKKMPVIGWLSGAAPGSPVVASALSAFRRGLGKMGFVDGRNVRFDYRWAERHNDRLPALAASLAADKVDVIIAPGSLPQALAAKAATRTIPIVFITGADPVAEGLVASLARPGGNLTGVAIQQIELSGKRVELLSELVPQAKTVAFLVNPNYGAAKRAERFIDVSREAASARGLRLLVAKAGSESQLPDAFARLAQLRADALVVAAYPLFWRLRKQIVALAMRYQVPAIYPDRVFTAAGGLISYGPNPLAAFRLAGEYAGRILKGEKPADLPVQQPTKFDLAINLKTAAALDLAVPQLLLAQADEVIQ